MIEVEPEEYKKARERLVLEEFHIEQLNLFKKKEVKPNVPDSIISGTVTKEMLELFPYQLTEGQASAVEESIADINSPNPMMRLIQGDVGCGKTTVAALATFVTAKDKKQSALMCPTETLAVNIFQLFQSYARNS